MRELPVIEKSSGAAEALSGPAMLEYTHKFDFKWRSMKRLAVYVFLLATHGSLRKFRNLFLTEWEHLLRRERLRGRPYLLKVDPTNVCNLRCPECYTGRLLNQRQRGQMTFEIFKRIVDENKDYVFKMNLYAWGESFLVKEIHRMIGYATENNIATVISSNMSLPTDRLQPEQLVQSGLKLLIMSIDGADQTINEKVRAGSRFDLIMCNVRAIVDAKRRLKSFYPILEWQYLVHDGNRHQIPQAKRMAKELGIDILRFSQLYTINDSFTLSEKASDWSEEEFENRQFVAGRCAWPYRSATVNWNGDVSPCCSFSASDNTKLAYGNIAKEGFDKIWNNAIYQETRHFVQTGKRRDKTILTPCLNCGLCNEK